MSSPSLKKCAEHCLEAGERCLVIDLHVCTGMDSTFMGMLAGLAMRLTKQAGGGRLEIAGASEKNVSSLEDLGLDAFMEINPGAASWTQRMEEIRGQLAPWNAQAIPPLERSREVLEAHKTLSAANEENAQKFETVVSLLEKELDSRSH